MNLSSNRRKFHITLHKKEILLLTSMFFISLFIRWIGLKHGFPLLTQPDEELIMDQAFFMTRYGFFYPGNPGTFARPNQILYTINYFYLNLMSYLRFGENYSARYQLFELHFYHYGRLLIAILGSLIPLVAYQIGKLIKPGLALAAGLVFMVFPSYVLHSLYVTPDIPITLFTLLVLYFTLRYLVKNEEWSIYIATIFSAINTAEKYPGLISLSIVGLGIIFKYLEQPGDTLKRKFQYFGRKLLIVVLVFIAALFLVAPKLFINHSLVLGGIVLSADSTHPGADHLGYLGRLFFYIRAFASWSNILAVVFIAAGCVALYKWRNKSALLLFYGALYWLLLSMVSLHWERWALPMYITPLFLIAAGISYAWNVFQNKPITRWFAIIIFSLFFAQQFVTSLHVPIARSFTDTRLIAGQYSSRNGIIAENSLYEGYTPLQEKQRFITIFEDFQAMQSDIEYIVLSSDTYDRYYHEPERYTQEVSMYEEIRRNYELVAKFEPSDPSESVIEKVNEILNFARHSLDKTTTDRYRGPVIEIYRVDTHQ